MPDHRTTGPSPLPDTGALEHDLVTLLGRDQVMSSDADRRQHAQDRLPYGLFKGRSGELPGMLPSLVVRPADAAQLTALLRLAAKAGVAVVPRGEGSGVVGGAVPLGGEVVIDLTRLDGIVALNAEDAMVTVRAGMNGWAFEAALNAQGWTSGHLPQSIEISTVGGWAACRGAGQTSTRYGKIEDMVLGLKAILADGTEVEVRPLSRRSVGPSIRDVFVGCEGTLAIITELTLRIWRKPAVERGMVLAFPDICSALSAIRQTLQAELRPAVARVYDQAESLARGQGVAQLARKPILAILEFHGSARMVDLEAAMALDIAIAHGGELALDDAWQLWRAHRYVSLSRDWQARGYFMDTIEVTGLWSALPTMYAAMRAAALAICPEVHFAAHWSHAYAEGACQYMTLRLPPMPGAKGLALHAKLWEEIQSLTLDHGGSIAHHHGAGFFRNPWMGRELGSGGMHVLQLVKDALDPANMLNPGKLGLRGRQDAIRIE